MKKLKLVMIGNGIAGVRTLEACALNLCNCLGAVRPHCGLCSTAL
ncbi:hypothetical protein [Pseudomonas sp. VI4.1]|nr:hypothetical protein [Pseudomonas sp. VI4.1]